MSSNRSPFSNTNRSILQKKFEQKPPFYNARRLRGASIYSNFTYLHILCQSKFNNSNVSLFWYHMNIMITTVHLLDDSSDLLGLLCKCFSDICQQNQNRVTLQVSKSLQLFCCYHFTKTEKHWNRSANKTLELLNLLWPLKLVSHKYTSPDTISAHAVYTQVILKFLGMEPLKHVHTTNMTSSA